MQDQIISNLTTTSFAAGNLAVEVESCGNGGGRAMKEKERAEKINKG